MYTHLKKSSAVNCQIVNSPLQVSCLFQEPLAHECPQMTENKFKKSIIKINMEALRTFII